MFRKMPFILVAMIIAILSFDPILPFSVKQTLYTLSLTIKESIVFLLPIIVFGLLFKVAVKLSRSATKIIGLILLSVCVSNFFSTLLSYMVGSWIYTLDLSIIVPNESFTLEPLWTMVLPKWIPNNKAMFLGILAGLVTNKFYPNIATKTAAVLEKVIGEALQKFVYIIPIFVAGFVVKLQYEQVVNIIIQDYIGIFAVIAIAQFGYIFLGYFLLNKARIPQFMLNIRNMLPAAISGFSSMSSAASMPLTIIGTVNNVNHKELARSVIPLTVNIHLIGDCFAIPIFCLCHIEKLWDRST